MESTVEGNQALSSNAAQLPPSKGKGGCRGCLRRGCGCFGVTLALCIAIGFWPVSCGLSSPGVYAYFPQETLFAYRNERVELAGGRVHPDLAVEYRKWILDLAKSANQSATAIMQLSLDHKLSQVVILEVPSAAAVIESAKAGSYGTEQMGEYLLYLIDNKPSEPEVLAIAAITDGMVAAGEAMAVRRVATVASGQEDSLFEARPDLRPLLATFSTSQVVTFTFQPLEIAEGAGCLGYILGGGNPLFSLVDLRGHAFGGRKDDRQCDVSIAYQYANRVPSSIVSSVFGVFSIFNTIPIGIPEEIGSPVYMDAEQERGMAMLTAGFDVEKCDEIDKKNSMP